MTHACEPNQTLTAKVAASWVAFTPGVAKPFSMCMGPGQQNDDICVFLAHTNTIFSTISEFDSVAFAFAVDCVVSRAVIQLFNLWFNDLCFELVLLLWALYLLPPPQGAE